MTVPGRRSRAAAIVVAAILASAGPATATQRPPGELQREAVAQEAFAAGRYPEALELYRGLYADTRHPTYLRNVGRCHQMLKQPGPAIESLREYLRVAPDVSPTMRQQVEGFIREMEELQRRQGAERAPPARSPALDQAITRKAPPRDERQGGRTWPWIAGGALVVAAGVVVGYFLLRPTATTALACSPMDCTLPTIRVDTR